MGLLCGVAKCRRPCMFQGCSKTGGQIPHRLRSPCAAEYTLPQRQGAHVCSKASIFAVFKRTNCMCCQQKKFSTPPFSGAFLFCLRFRLLLKGKGGRFCPSPLWSETWILPYIAIYRECRRRMLDSFLWSSYRKKFLFLLFLSLLLFFSLFFSKPAEKLKELLPLLPRAVKPLRHKVFSG